MNHDRLLVLDIDNTLICASNKELKNSGDYGVYSFGGKDNYRIYKRPYVDQFLTYGFNNFTVGIWSSASMQHIQNALDCLKVHESNFEFIYDNTKCTNTYSNDGSGAYLVTKKFHKLKKKGYNLERVLGVDDNKWAYQFNYGNLLQVHSWEGNEWSKDEPGGIDRDLLLLIDYLEMIKDEPNYRNLYKQNWKKVVLQNIEIKKLT